MGRGDVRVIVTRPEHQAAELSLLLAENGFVPVEVPMIQILDASDDGAALRNAVGQLDSYDWVVLTSPNGARRFCAALGRNRLRPEQAVAAIGPATVTVLRSEGITPALVADPHVAEALLDAFPAPPPGGGKVLMARASEARNVLPDGLRASGWDVRDVAAYRTVVVELTDANRRVVEGAHVVTFTSSSTVRHFVEQVGVEAMPRTVACIGPVTAATARDMGLHVDVEAPEHTTAGLVRALRSHLSLSDR